MGLDFIFIVNSIEDRLGVRISDDEVADLVLDRDIQMSDLCALVDRKVCADQRVRRDLGFNRQLWRKIQMALAATTGVAANQIELQSRLPELFPISERGDLWRKFRQSVPFDIPELEYPRWVKFLGMLFTLAWVLAEQLQVLQLGWLPLLWPWLAIAGVLLWVETYTKLLGLLATLRTQFPAKLTTVKDVCKHVLGVHNSDFARTPWLIDQSLTESTWTVLCEIVSQELGASLGEITPQTRLVHDLGMD